MYGDITRIIQLAIEIQCYYEHYLPKIVQVYCNIQKLLSIDSYYVLLMCCFNSAAQKLSRVSFMFVMCPNEF